MNHDDPIAAYVRKLQDLDAEWQTACARYTNAQGALQKALARSGAGDPSLDATHDDVARVRQVLDELQQIQERMKAALDRIDRAIR
ncbi:MAG: hypothetical protein ACYCUE_01225 [Steroidobacteraceae bacterium]